MSRPRPSTWVALLALPLLVGAVLLMHGLDAGAHPNTGSHVSVAAGGEGHRHADNPSGCEDCTGAHQVLAACVAVAATAATIRVARTLRARLALVSPAIATTIGQLGERLRLLVRPPDPAWVRLSVMRC